MDIVKLVNERNGEKLYSLVIDSMSIRKRLNVNRANSKVEGHVTIGDSISWPAKHWSFCCYQFWDELARFPVGYFLWTR